MSLNKPAERPSLWRIAAYGQAGLPLALTAIPVTLYIPAFYAQDLGVDLTVIGLALVLARIGDVFTDPLIGTWSDRSKWRYGRRRSWVLIGLPVIVLGVWFLFQPREGAGGFDLFVWVSVYYLGWTLVTIPYVAWGAEMSPDYAERSRITGTREMFGVLGVILAALLPVLAVGGAEVSGAGLGPQMQALAVSAAILLPLSIGILLGTVPEPKLYVASAVGFWRGMKIALGNAPFMRLLASGVAGRIGSKINESVALLYFAHALGLGPRGPLLILVLLAFAVIGTPFWIWLGGRITKHYAIAAAAATGCTAFALIPFVAYGDFTSMAVLMAVVGFGATAGQALGQSMAADAIDLDALRSREPRAGLLFAFWGMAIKGADAVGVGIALPMLAFLGFDPLNQNGPDEILALKLVYAILPIAFWIVAVAFIWNFPITPERQRRIRALAERRALVSRSRNSHDRHIGSGRISEPRH